MGLDISWDGTLLQSELLGEIPDFTSQYLKNPHIAFCIFAVIVFLIKNEAD
jgi:hypothetical protein